MMISHPNCEKKTGTKMLLRGSKKIRNAQVGKWKSNRSRKRTILPRGLNTPKKA